ncbi:MAG: CHRD domain-containing protein, partial [Thermomicrobiales bacterium]
MRVRRSGSILTLVAILIVATLGWAVTAGAEKLAGADQGGRPLSATLDGASEVPVSGDPDGSGTAMITLNPGKGQVCVELSVSNIAPATAAHIHEASVGVPGPVVVHLPAPTDGFSSGCVSADSDLIRDITRDPDNYY